MSKLIAFAALLGNYTSTREDEQSGWHLYTLDAHKRGQINGVSRVDLATRLVMAQFFTTMVIFDVSEGNLLWSKPATAMLTPAMPS